MRTTGASSAIDTRLIRVLAAMCKNILAKTPSDAALDSPESDVEARARSLCGPA
jgi:hypothetical protein